jgi:hypothetical protein
MVRAAARLPSAAAAAFALQRADVVLSARPLQRIAGEIGDERIRPREHQVNQRRRRAVPVRLAPLPGGVAVEGEGGRRRTRAEGCGPGVQDQQNQEDKVACRVSLKSQVHDSDPQAEPPESFREPRRVQRLVQPLKGQAAAASPEAIPAEATPPPAAATDRRGAPEQRLRTGVASLADGHPFGPMGAAAAQERGFDQAKRRVVVGDGAA